jgi:CheY-like chemotaxis protein
VIQPAAERKRIRLTVDAAEAPEVFYGDQARLQRDEDRHEAIRAGFQLYLTKPIDAVSLVEAVASLAAGTHAPEHE